MVLYLRLVLDRRFHHHRCWLYMDPAKLEWPDWLLSQNYLQSDLQLLIHHPRSLSLVMQLTMQLLGKDTCGICYAGHFCDPLNNCLV